MDLTDQRLGFWQGVAATECSMSGFDRYPLRFFGRELRQQNVQCLDLTDQRLGFLAGSCGYKMLNVDLTDQRLGFWQGVAATKCSMS